MTTCLTATFVMPNAEELATERSKANGEPYLAWYDSLSKGIRLAVDSMVDPDAVMLLSTNCSQSSQFLLIMEALNEHAKENPYGANAFNLVVYHVEKSPYTLQAWIESLDYFYKWLSQNGRQASLTAILNYIDGCVDKKASTKGPELKESLKRVLDTYGFQD